MPGFFVAGGIEMARHIGIRRWGDACFHEVEEVLEDGYIVQGIFIHKDDVVELREWRDGEDPGCNTPTGESVNEA